MPIEIDNCKIEITKNGLDIQGKCAQGLLEVFNDIFNKSTASKYEIFACACLNPDKGEIERTVIGNVGASTSVSPGGVSRICPEDTLQLSYHTHPTFKKANFSPADGTVIVDRFNKGYDDAHCVIGENEYRCIFHTNLKTKKSH